MRLRGYRAGDLPLLDGDWLPGELLGLPVTGRPPLADPAGVPAPTGPDEELCVLRDAGFARFAELDHVHRRARLETGLRPEAAGAAAELLRAALTHAFDVLGLRRLYGWVTPVVRPPEALLTAAGLTAEADVPGALWLDGRPVDRQIWGVTGHG